MLVSREWDEARMFRQSLYHLLEEHHRSSNCFDVCDALLSFVQPRERQLLDSFFPGYSMAEDHVRIVMVAHCTQNTLASKAYPEAEFFAGLGVSCQPEMARLRWRDDLINYSGIRDEKKMVRKLTEHDKMEKVGLLVMGEQASPSIQLLGSLMTLLPAPMRLLWFLVAGTVASWVWGSICVVVGSAEICITWCLVKILKKNSWEIVNDSNGEGWMDERVIGSGTRTYGQGFVNEFSSHERDRRGLPREVLDGLSERGMRG